MMKLSLSQELFWRMISAPDGVAAGLSALPESDRLLRTGIDGWIRGDERVDAVERLDIYASMYFFRLLDCLAEDFPALHAVVGHDTFHHIARDYVATHPSRHPSLRAFGAALSDFLERDPLREQRPYLGDLARFEWSLLEAFDAADRTPLPPERLKTLPAETWPLVRLELSPSLRVIDAAAPVHEVYAAATDGREIPSIAMRRTVLRIWRHDLRVFHRVIDDLEWAALQSIERGEGFAATCEAATRIVGEERAALEVARTLDRWLDDGLVVGFDISATG